MRELARLLWQARLDGSTIQADRVVLPATLDEAYAIQRDVIALSGYEVSGFKIGSTSIEAQRMLGTTEPGSSPVLAPFIHASPARVQVSPAHMPAVEGEFAFMMGEPLPPRPRPYSRDEVAGAVAAVAGAIEVVGTRFAGGLTGKGRLLTTADGGVNIALATGPWRHDWQTFDLPTHRVQMLVNGRKMGEGPGSRALGDPMNVLVWLANQQSRLGRGLHAGEIVSTGTCTGLDPVGPGDQVIADFGPLGQVAIAFEPIRKR